MSHPRSHLFSRRSILGSLVVTAAVALPVAALTSTATATPQPILTPTTPGAPTQTTPTTPVSSSTTPTAPPPVTILSGALKVSGDIFITPTGDTSQYANGPEILSPSGRELWFKAIPTGETAADFQTQTLDGKPVLTYWVGTNFGGLSNGTDYILNQQEKQIATVTAGRGLTTDGHEFLITPQNTALVLSYDTATANLTSIGGAANQTVIDGIVQEINIHTHKVLWQWDSADHVPYSASEEPLPASASTPWDWFHVNAVHLGPSGTLLIDSRDTWTVFDVNRHTGGIEWRLGGKDSSFSFKTAAGQKLNDAKRIFAWQHDPEYLGDDTLSFFDNESAGSANTGDNALTDYSHSRTVRVKLNFLRHTATLVEANAQPEGQIAPSQGNAQTLTNGDQFVEWGSLPYFSEFSAGGKLLFNAEFPTGVNSYRGYVLPWGGSAAAELRR